jgi:hypothetical protein
MSEAKVKPTYSWNFTPNAIHPFHNVLRLVPNSHHHRWGQLANIYKMQFDIGNGRYYIVSHYFPPFYTATVQQAMKQAVETYYDCTYLWGSLGTITSPDLGPEASL